MVPEAMRWAFPLPLWLPQRWDWASTTATLPQILLWFFSLRWLHTLQLVAFRLSRPCSDHGTQDRCYPANRHLPWPVQYLHERAPSYPDIHSWPVPLQPGALLRETRWRSSQSRLTILFLTHFMLLSDPQTRLYLLLRQSHHLPLFSIPGSIVPITGSTHPQFLSLSFFYHPILDFGYSHPSSLGTFEHDSALQRLEGKLLTGLSVCLRSHHKKFITRCGFPFTGTHFISC